MISELKELLGDYLSHSASLNAEYGSRNLICVAIGSDCASSRGDLPSPATAVNLIKQLNPHKTAVLPDRRSAADETHQINHLLGNEFNSVIVDGSAAWPTNTLGAAAGAVQYPGTLFLLLPNGLGVKNDSTAYEVYLKSELSKRLKVHPECPLLFSLLPWRNQTDGRGSSETQRQLQLTQQTQQHWHADQQAVKTALMKRSLSNERTVDVLIAKRGRGKSASLGLLLNDLAVLHSSMTVTLTASHSRQVSSVNKHMTAGPFPYTALDAAQDSTGDVLIIDEAGSVPLPVLCALIQGFTHTILASTTDGYEGSARALATRFTELCQSEGLISTPVKFHNLEKPIRWPVSDKLEPVLTAILHLDADARVRLPGDLSTAHKLASDEFSYEQMTSSKLLKDREALETTFGLLMQAHYQTTSRDLQHLLDQDELQLHVQRLNGTLTAACLLVEEGALSDTSQTEIVSGNRRPKHQRLPMMLQRQSSSDYALTAQYWRIIRIAVQPAFQRRGCGTALLDHVVHCSHEAAAEKVPQFIGASFGATAGRLQFWLNAGFQPFQWGFRLNPRSGTRTISVLKAVQHTDTQTQNADEVLAKATHIFHDSFSAFASLYERDIPWIHGLYGPLRVDADFLRTVRELEPDANLISTVDDNARLTLWQDGRLSLHEVWGPVIRALGSEEGVVELNIKPSLSAKQITKTLKTQIAECSGMRF